MNKLLGGSFDMKKINAILVVAFSLALSSCALNSYAPTPAELAAADYGKKPVNYKPIIKDYVSETLIDPESARFTNFSTPSKNWLSKGSGFSYEKYFGWLVCVDVNAKNRYGGYAGKQRNYFIMRGDEIVFFQNRSTRDIALGIYMTIECQYT